MNSYKISQRYKSRGNLTWYGRISDGGEFRYISLKTTRKSEALEWLNAMNASRFLPETIREQLEPKDKRIADAVQPFLDSISASKGEESKTLQAYTYRLKAFTTWLDNKGISTFQKFSAERANEFNLFLAESYAAKSHRELLRLVGQFCEWARKVYKLGDYRPLESVQPPRLVKRTKEFWTQEQLDAILDNAPTKEFRLFWSLMAFAALRHAEAVSFSPSMIVGNQLHIIGKGEKEAFLPISNRLQSEFDRYGTLADGMFRTAVYKHADRSIAALRKAVEAAGIERKKDDNNHKLRHSCISNWARAGVGFKHLAELARHSDARITYNTYAHLLPSDLENAVNKK